MSKIEDLRAKRDELQAELRQRCDAYLEEQVDLQQDIDSLTVKIVEELKHNGT
jgi:hypothetical protein